MNTICLCRPKWFTLYQAILYYDPYTFIIRAQANDKQDSGGSKGGGVRGVRTPPEIPGKNFLHMEK